MVFQGCQLLETKPLWAVLVSMLAKCIVGSLIAAMPQVLPPVLLLLPNVAATAASSVHEGADHNHRQDTSFMQLLPIFQARFPSMRTITQVACQSNITAVNAVALSLVIPFFGAASGFCRNANFTTFHELGASSSSMTISWIFSCICLIIIAHNGIFWLLDFFCEILALACNTKSREMSAILISSVKYLS